jgi:hypothetical protein
MQVYAKANTLCMRLYSQSLHSQSEQPTGAGASFVL